MQFPSRADRAFERFRESGDPRALARCFDLTARELARVARHLTRDPHRAEDLLQSTYLAALEQRAEFQPGERVLPWLLGILANRARAARKSAARRPDPHRTAEPSGEPDPAEAAAWNETSDTLRAVLLGFPSPYREVVTLHVLHGMSAREIGEALGVPAGTVRTQLVRGLERLRRRLPAGLALRAWFFPLPLARLGGVREAVLARAGVELPAGLGAALLGGVVFMKAIVALLGVAGLVGAGWWLWPEGQEETHAPLVAAAERAPLEEPAPTLPAAEVLPELTEVVPASRASLPLARESMLVVSVTRSGGAPAPGATVRLIQASDDGNPELHERSVVTDADGIARVDELPAGRWTAGSDRCDAAREVTLARGESVRVELELPPGVHVTGRVVDERQRARPGTGIWLSAGVGESDRGLVVAVADATGRFELDDVEPGRWIAARAEGYLDSYCAALEGAPGESLELVLELAAGGARLRGCVVDGAGSPVARAAVMAGYSSYRGPVRISPPRPERPGMRGWSDEDGRFELWGPVGRTPLWVRGAGFAPWTATVECTEDADEVRVELARGAVVRGRVLDEDGAPVAHEPVEVFHFALEPAAGNAFGGPEWGRPQAMTDDAGEFVVRELPAGRVRLTLEIHGWIARGELELAEGEERLWEGTLGAPGVIEGFVRDSSGAPLVGWSVWARTYVQGVRAPNSARTDALGAFTLEPCDDEPYRIGLRGPGSLMARGDHELAGVRPGDGPIELVVPDEHRASAGFSGLVRDGAGPVIEGLQVSLRRVDGFDGLGSASGAPRFEGERFFLGSVLPGRYRVHVGRGYAVGVELGEFEVGPGETKDLGTIELPEDGDVALEVLDAAGEPLAEARLVLHPLGSNHGDVVTVTGGRGRSRPLSAGTYQLQPFGGRTPLFRQPVEVLPNETTTVKLCLPHAVSRRLRYPPMERDTFVREVWTDGSGRVLTDGLPTYPSPTGYEREVFLVPDTYTVELTFEGFPPQRIPLVIEDREDPEAILELPDPRM